VTDDVTGMGSGAAKFMYGQTSDAGVSSSAGHLFQWITGVEVNLGTADY